jgi:hypothetical protein
MAAKIRSSKQSTLILCVAPYGLSVITQVVNQSGFNESTRQETQ